MERAFFYYLKKFYYFLITHIIEQMLEFLPIKVKEALAYLNIKFLYEIRLRADKPILVNYNGEYRYLSSYGITDHMEKAIRPTYDDIADCVYRAGNYSVYSVEEQLKKGFLTAKNGERIGLAGEYVFQNGQPLAIRNFSSLCIRVPHEVIGCAEEIYYSCMRDKVRNLLLMSSPGLGKTTILRDLTRIIAQKNMKNVLICDERGEISAGNVGESCDVVKYSDKQTAFEAGIRALRPDIIVTDELSATDCEALTGAIYAGVGVIASAHFSDIKHIKAPFWGLFERYVFLDACTIGKIRAIYDENGKEL